MLPLDERLGFKGLSAGALRRWRLLLVAALGLLALASLAWRHIPRREDPNVAAPGMRVTLAYPGASPEDVESQILRVVEPDLVAMEGIEDVEALALPNVALFDLKVADGTPLDATVERVRAAVRAKSKDLPAEVSEPEVARGSTLLIPQLVVAVVGNRSTAFLTEAAQALKQAISAVPGVSSVRLRGERQPAIVVRLDPVSLARHRLSVDEVVKDLRLASARVPAGELRVGPLLTYLQVTGDLTSAAALMKAPVGANVDEHGASQTVSLGDVAEVREDELTPRERFVVDGQPAVALEVCFRGEVNAVAIGARVEEAIRSYRSSLSEDVRVEIVHDQPQWIERSIATLLESLGEGALLVMLIITVGMGWRSALVVVWAVPLAIGGALLGLYVLGFSLDPISIAGLIVALGVLVDDAVVVTESIRIMRDKGLSAARAAVYGTARVFWANNGTTAVACASFMPLLLMSGGAGAFIRSIPIAVIVALTTSLLVAQLVTPCIATLLLGPPRRTAPVIADHEPFDPKEDSALGHAETNVLIRGLKNGYAHLLPWIVRHAVLVIIAFTALLGASIVLLPRIGFLFFPKAEKSVLFVSVTLPRGTDPEITGDKLRDTLQVLAKDPDVAQTSAVLGAGYPWIFLGRHTRGERKDFADVLVRLKPHAHERDVAQRLRRSLMDVTGAALTVEELYYGPPVVHPILVRVYGDDYDKLRTYAEAVKEHLRSRPGTVNVTDSLAESVTHTRVRIDADRAFRLGVTPAQVGSTLRWLHGEDKVMDLRRGDDVVQVVLTAKAAGENPLVHVADTPIPTTSGSTVAIREVGDVTLAHGFAELKRRNGRRMVEITADVNGMTLPSSVIEDLDVWLKTRTWAPGYGFAHGGAEEEMDGSFRRLAMEALASLLVVFLLLVVMFDSFRLATVVMVAVPYGLVGAIFGLASTRNAFGFMAFLGVISLIGVYVNHKIYFLDRMVELLKRGESLVEAMSHAGQDRLRPVVLTALTAVLGLLPLALTGGPLWAPFGWVNVFGLLASIPLSLVLLPALVAVAYRARGRRA